MPNGRKSGLPSYGLPYPMASAIGRQRANELIGGYAEYLARLYSRAMQYGHEETQQHVGTLVDLYGRVMNPAEQTINGARGLLGVYHASALGDGAHRIMDAQETLRMLTDKAILPTGQLFQPVAPGGVFYRPVAPYNGNGSIKPSPALVTQPPGVGLFRPQPIAVQPRPSCGPTIINLACPGCGQAAPCNWNLNILAQAIATAVNQIAIALHVTQWQSMTQQQQQALINQVAQVVAIQIPPAPEQQKQLGADCEHPLHICLCGGPADPRCLGSTPDNPAWIGVSIDQGSQPICHAP